MASSEEFGDEVCSEVNAFLRKIDKDDNCAEQFQLAKFVFSTPKEEAEKAEDWIYGGGFGSKRGRTRSHPALGEDSDSDGDIEVPRFQSLDCVEDSDGDLEVEREVRAEEEVVVLEHKTHTDLDQVGLQVWRGALLLADWLLQNMGQVKKKKVLEVGAGTGLASLIAARCGAHVIASDINDHEVLDLMQRNIARNASLAAGGEISVMPLDFNDDLAQVKGLDKVDLLLAGDVIYDDEITDRFVRFLLRLRQHLGEGPLKALVTLERRIVFTVADLEERCPAYERLMAKLEEEKDKIVVTQTEIDWEQHMCYERSNELVLLEILVI